MESISLIRVSYKELQENKMGYNDQYGIISGYLTKPVREALLANPNLDDCSKSAANLLVFNGSIVGRYMLMPTKLKIDDHCIMAQCGGGNEVAESFRGKGLGTILVRDTIMNCEYPFYLGQLYSTAAASILRKMNICIFSKPLYNKQMKTRSIWISKGLRGFPLMCGEFFGDLYLRLCNLPNRLKLSVLRNRYKIRQETIVPQWVETMTLNDGHKYMEIHDQKWLQWNLDNKFTENKNDKNSFYAVYDRKELPCGFFMTKERFEENPKGVYKNLVRGTVVEWGSWNEVELSEADLNLMAISTFSSRVEKINTVISSDGFEKEMKRMGFSFRGMYQMTFNPTDTECSDTQDQNQWRIRYGGCNTILI